MRPGAPPPPGGRCRRRRRPLGSAAGDLRTGIPNRSARTMRLPLGFLLFLALAALLLVNGVRAFIGGAGSAAGSSPVLTGVVSILASAALVAGAFYMFQF